MQHLLATPIKIILFLLIGITLFFASCKKDESIIGLEIQPEGDNFLLGKDTIIKVTAYTVSDDSFASQNRTIGLLGSYVDPIFGKAKAEIVTQVRLKSYNVDFSSTIPSGTSLQADSLILYLDYSGHYGEDTLTIQKINIYELTEKLSFDSTYYANHNVQYENNPIGSIEYSPTPSGDSIAIKIQGSLAQKILTSDKSYFTSDTMFNKLFNGLYISTNQLNNGGSIIYYSLTSTKSKMVLYYNDSLNYTFLINEKCARINLFKQDYISYPVNTNLNDTTNEFDAVYVQSMGGARAKIIIPQIKTWKDSSIAILKAELIIELEDEIISYQTQYAVPDKLLLVAALVGESTKYEYLADYYMGTSYFGGSYNSANRTYRFNIANQLQKILKGTKENNGFYLLPESNRVTANRAILKSGKNAGIRLKLTYVKL